jgi:hypothetical protein
MLMLALRAIGIKGTGQKENTHGNDIVSSQSVTKKINDCDAA